MGLFVNKQKTCPVCNRPTPRIFPTKIEGMPICKECGGKIDLPDGMADQMSLESFRQYLDFYEQNQVLRDIFAETYRVDFTGFNSIIVMDTANRLFRLKGWDTSLVFEASDLKSFCILEDNVPLFEGEGDILRCHSSKVPELVKNMAPQIAQFRMQQEMYRELERMERELDNREREKNGEKTGSSYYASGPDFDAPVPFKYFYVELTLTHPYWGGFRGKLDAPGFSRYNPSVDTYLKDYQEKVGRLYTLAGDLMRLIDPDAQEVRDVDDTPVDVQTRSVGDNADELQRYKELLDAGIITEEEFTAKKRQLLGI